MDNPILDELNIIQILMKRVKELNNNSPTYLNDTKNMSIYDIAKEEYNQNKLNYIKIKKNNKEICINDFLKFLNN